MNSFMIAWCINPWASQSVVELSMRFATCSMFWPWPVRFPQSLRYEEGE